MLRFDWRSCFFHFPRLATRCGLYIAGEQRARGRFRPIAHSTAVSSSSTRDAVGGHSRGRGSQPLYHRLAAR